MKLADIKNFTKNTKANIYFDHSLNKINWFNIGGKSKIFFKPESLNELISFLKLYKKRGKIFSIGAGSNILITDGVFDGVVIKLGSNFRKISILNENIIIAGSNVTDRAFSDFAMENNIGGFEFLSCIPGTIGGGIRMNSGCYGIEFKDILVSVQAIDFDGNVLSIPANKIKFSYRGVNLPNNLIFLSATFKGKKKKKKKIKKKILKLKKIKEKTQPSKIKTGGSTFKNPISQTQKKAWELIKNSVPKNTKFGDAAVSEFHSNFLINKKNAKFKDMIRLISYIKSNVKKKFNVNLELEIILVK